MMRPLLTSIALIWLIAAPSLCRAGALGGCCGGEAACETESAGHDGCPQQESDCLNCAGVCRAAFRPSERSAHPTFDEQAPAIAPIVREAAGVDVPFPQVCRPAPPGVAMPCHVSDVPLLI